MIEHGPIASLRWPSMRMQFRLARPDLTRGLAVGDRVDFRFHQSGEAYVVDEIRKAEAQR
jgi:Cu/Ag efflux protein CusF